MVRSMATEQEYNEEEPACPQVGSGGIHHEAYYEGGRCEWCGAIRKVSDDPEEEHEDSD
jgi:hypothetical protein